MIHLEAPTHRIPAGMSGSDDEVGPVLTGSAETYGQALAALEQALPDGHRLTWIRRVDEH